MPQTINQILKHPNWEKNKTYFTMSTNINELIGEATAYDKKLQLEAKRPKCWLKSVSAFANGEG